MEFILGFAVGLLLVAAVGVILVRQKGPMRFDERQLLARGKAARLALKVLVVGCVLTLMLEAAQAPFPVSMSQMLLISLFACAAAFACSCIVNDAWMALNERPRMVFVIGTVAIVVNAALGLTRLCVYGDDLFVWCNLGCAVLVAVIYGFYLCRRAMRRRGNSDEEPEA